MLLPMNAMDGYHSACGARVEAYLAERYGIPIVLRDIPPPFKGDLDGSEIHIDHDSAPGDRLFLVLHLFGHTVQWNVNPRSREIGRPLPVPVDEALLPEIIAYEQEAASYAISLLYQLEIFDLDQWMSDVTASDLEYLLHYYRTGERRDAHAFFTEGRELIAPLPIPGFRPTRWVFRSYGVVV